VEERRETAVFLLGCDMPLVTSDLVRLVMDRSGPAVAAAPMGPVGVQPLCALYTLACLPEVRKRALSEDRSLHGLLSAVEAVEIGEGEVGSVSDPATVFWNVNTEADGVRAAELLSSTLGGGR
jgi:molybdopterin-guanine dinucleotide biosynthesis protein A